MPEIMQLIAALGKSGTLTLCRAEQEIRIEFRKGEIASGAARDAPLLEQVATTLRRCGATAGADLAMVRRNSQNDATRFGQQLIDQGLAEPGQIQKAFEMNMLELLVELLSWTEGRYDFSGEGAAPSSRSCFEPVGVQHFLMVGMSEMDEWPVILAKLGSLEVVFESNPGIDPEQAARDAFELDPLALDETPPVALPEPAIARGKLSANEAAVLARLDGKTSIAAVVETMLLGRHEICRTVCDLWERGEVRPARQKVTATTTTMPIERPAPIHKRKLTRSGTVILLRFPALLRDLYARRVTGVLSVSHQGADYSLMFSHGTVVAASNPRGGQRLGDILVRRGTIDRTSLDDLVASNRGTAMGRLLVESGLITSVELDNAVVQQVRETVLPMFSWQSLAYELEEGELDVPDLPVCSLSTAELILAGCDEPGHTALAQRLLDDELVLAPPADQHFRFQKAQLKSVQGFLLAQMNGSTCVAELLMLSPLETSETYRVIYALLQAGLVEFVNVGERVATAGYERPRPDTRGCPTPPTPEEDVMNEFARISRLDPFDTHGVLGVPEDASPATIDAAYRRLAKKYHPDLGRTAHQKQMMERVFSRIVWAGQTLRAKAKQHT